ncbi:glycosyltransferase family 2 protein [Methylobacterium durans]|uniref:glycosyltransferase family 2 protein n=1 Tax=Methylobacterium durans TaxID=2202825 RepID=UPI002AFE2204|nr:glycosyltransferase family 2 protein [Methylobacterium durans]MEA1832918.1 glycosyltransferase family 2 protein [Methylobacterium durans]
MVIPTRARPWLGRETPFSLHPTADPVFDRRLVLAGGGEGSWITLSVRGDPAAPPLRPMLRLLREGFPPEDFLLPGLTEGVAHWLGLLPPDTVEIRLALGPGAALLRAGLRTHASVFAECLVKRPQRVVPALYTFARRDARRYRDILRGACAVTPLDRYTAWAAARGTPSGVGAPPPARRVRVIVCAGAGEGGGLARTLAALGAQTHSSWHALVLHGAGSRLARTDDARVEQRPGAASDALGDVCGDADACLFLAPGDVLRADTLALLVRHLFGRPGLDLAYADSVGPDGRPHLKPDWSPDLALATGYVGRPALLAAEWFARAPRGARDPSGLAADFVLAAATARAAIHVPQILCRTEAPAAVPDVDGIARHLAARGSPAAVTERPGGARLVWPLPAPAPKVSVIIPSRDRLDLIARVCRGVLDETAYGPLEVVIVDNGSTDPAVLAHYDDLRRDARVRVLPFPEPFNFSAMVNAGVAAASGEVVLLLNNDVAVLEPGWLDAMVRQACRPEIGAVGAKLLYGDGRLQHAGVVVGLGGRAGHILRRRPADTPGRLGQMRVAHEVSAVTAACLAVRRARYEAVGGFDAEAFPIDFNDVDFCLRLGARGWKTIWTPDAVLAHLESVSRGPAIGAARRRFEAEAACFSERWRDVIRHDPFYHPALSVTTFGEDLE